MFLERSTDHAKHVYHRTGFCDQRGVAKFKFVAAYPLDEVKRPLSNTTRKE